jgi:hemolysin activation/secretion protein
MAMPAQPGDVLNIRDLDHAAENVQRLGYALEQYIVPRVAAQPGADAVHDVAIAWAASPHLWQGSLNADNSASPAFGRTHVGAQLALNNLLGLADQTYLSVGGNVEARGPLRKQHSQALNVTLPWGYHRFSLSHSSSQSALGIHGTTVTFTNRRSDIDTQLEWAYTLYRDGHYKITPELTLGWRDGSSHIEDVELVVQRRHAKTRGAGVNLSWVGSGQQIQSTFSVTQTSRQHRAGDDFFFAEEPKVATTRRWSGQWQRAFTWQQQAAHHTLQWDVQSTRHPTPLSTDISLGGRYTVRGFTGDRPLTASDGMWVRNEWQWQAAWPWPGLSPYLGLDAGKVWGATAPATSQRKRWLAGAALGVRGQWGTAQHRYSIDFSVATPLHGLYVEGEPRPRLVPYLFFSMAF